MLLTKDSTNKILRHNRWFSRLEQIFIDTHTNLASYISEDSRLPQFKFQKNDNENFFNIENYGITLRFTFLMTLNDGTTKGQFFVHQTKPKFGIIDKLIGAFDFDANGTTNFKISETSGELVQLPYMGLEIMSHYFLLALKAEETPV